MEFKVKDFLMLTASSIPFLTKIFDLENVEGFENNQIQVKYPMDKNEDDCLEQAISDYDKAVAAYLNSEISFDGLQQAKSDYRIAVNSNSIVW